jgi:hypothetical protein
MPDELSREELQQLQEIAKALPAGHPAMNKVNSLLSSQKTQFEKEREPEGSTLWRGTKAFANDVAGTAKGVLGNVPGMKTISDISEGKVPDLLPGPDLTDSISRVKDMQAADASRKKAGYSPLYRGAAALGQASGVIDPSAMEEAAKHADTASIVGHAVLPTIGAAVGADEALGGKGRVAAGRGLTAIGQGVGAARDVVGRTLRTPEQALKPGVQTAAKLVGAGAGHLTGIPGMEFGGGAIGPSLAEMILPKHPGVPAEAVAPIRTTPFEVATPAKAATLPNIAPAAVESIAKPAGAEPAPTRLPTLFEKGTRPEMLKMPNLVDQAAGVKPLKPDVPLIEQLTKQTAEEPAAIDPMKEKYPDPAVRQMVRANGERAYEAAKSDPGLMKDLHNLTRVDLRQALVNAGEDMGQTTVSNSKFAGEGSIPREEAFNRLLDKGLKPEQILKLAKPKPAETSQ